MTLECEGALSDLILQAARAAIPAVAHKLIILPDCGEHNKPLLPLLVGLLDAAKVVANAVNDNAWDNLQPLDRNLATELGCVVAEIDVAINTATAACE